MTHIKEIFLALYWSKYQQAMQAGRIAEAVTWLAMMDNIIQTLDAGKLP